MRLEHRHRVEAPPERVREALRSLAFTGAEVLERRPDGAVGEVVRLRFLAPVAFDLDVGVVLRDEGIALGAVEGPVPSVDATVDVAEDGEGSRIQWRLALALPTHLPGPLARELEQALLPAWAAALEETLTAGDAVEP